MITAMGLRDLFRRGPTVRVQLLLRGRIGTEWLDVDQTLDVPAGTTLRQFITLADRRGLPLSAALAASPHLHDTLMWNGERAPVADHGERVLADGDQLYLLAPLAGG
ncbi:MAG: MoaD/ThiS family protein [Kofleriaceae bacterium]|nr:MoaD/ThiS family protein [Kofleriaceae bacterium]MBP6840208.1 MoaD/ThiS family protein [Kofleriaceae bacterium]